MTADLAADTATAPAPAHGRLRQISDPAGLRAVPAAGLDALATEIRAFLVDKVCATGGHLGVNLGVVELTIALHRVFDSPLDVLLFDTGHQAYVHKILTGRAGGFDDLRQEGGLSGYPSRAESEHDWIESSHASTALAYADGIAKAHRLLEQADRHVVAVVGDGAMTGGLAWEGLNNLAERPDRPVVVVLNDNGRSYDLTIGGLARHLADVRGRCRLPGDASTKSPPATVFEQLGLGYIGPIDGHDMEALETAFTAAKSTGRTVVVHCLTEKGRGYAPAETDEADRMHGIGVLAPATGKPLGQAGPTWTSVFADEITEIGWRRPDVVAITAAMRLPVGLHKFGAAFPDRLFDVGIAEQQAVCSAAGLAAAGLHPVVAVYATFLNRAYDQVLMDVALHRSAVTFVLDRAGITGPDGASHHGLWDTAILATVPGLRVAAPRDPARLRELLGEAIAHDGPAALRFPKASAGDDLPALARMDGVDLLNRTPAGSLDVLLVSAGAMAGPCLKAAAILEVQGVGVTVADPRWILPVNPFLTHLASRHRLTVTVEDAVVTGGMGAQLTQAVHNEALATTPGAGIAPVLALGLPTAFIDHGNRADLLARAGLDGSGIARSALTALAACQERR